MLTRRSLLGGLAATAVLLKAGVGLGEDSPAFKLYPLDDYTNPTKKLDTFRTIDPKNIPGIVVYKVWTTWCDPCVEEVPGYNTLHREYGSRVRFLSVLDQHTVDQQPQQVIREPEEFRRQCIEQGIRRRYSSGAISSDLVSQIIQQAQTGQTGSYVAREVIESCERTLQEPPKKPSASTPEDREALGQAFNELKRAGKVPVFPTYVLDHWPTKEFLRLGDAVPYTAIFVDGTFQGGWHGSGDTSAAVLKPQLEALLQK